MEDLQREELLRIEHLSVTFTQYDGWFFQKNTACDPGFKP